MPQPNKYAAHRALDPFFEIIQRGLQGLVVGGHFYDAIADDALFEFLYEFPVWPRTIQGRAALVAAIRDTVTTSSFTRLTGSSFTARKIHAW